MNKKGISLVALVITIIVLIILTGAVIATFIEGGIIDQAKDAVKRSDYTTLREAYDMAYNVAKIDMVTGTGEEIDEINVLKETVGELGLEDFSFTVDSVSYSGDNTYISDWVDANFLFKELVNSGFIISTVDGKKYITGLVSEKSSDGANITTTAGDILTGLGEGYNVVDQNNSGVDDSTVITTGYQVKKGEDIYATIVVKGEVNYDKSVTLADGSDLVSILNNAVTPTVAQLIAADINNDGLLTQDDNVFPTMIYLGYVDANEFQSNKITTKPIILEEYIETTKYTWYTKTDIFNMLIEEGYTIATGVQKKITLESGTTYTTLESGISEALGVSANITVDDKSKTIANNDSIELNLPYEFGEDIYLKECIITLKAVVE